MDPAAATIIAALISALFATATAIIIAVLTIRSQNDLLRQIAQIATTTNPEAKRKLETLLPAAATANPGPIRRSLSTKVLRGIGWFLTGCVFLVGAIYVLLPIFAVFSIIPPSSDLSSGTLVFSFFFGLFFIWVANAFKNRLLGRRKLKPRPN
jgi:hypothetical protein